MRLGEQLTTGYSGGGHPAAMPHASRFIRSHLKVRHLTLLAALGRHASIAQAAEAVGFTQPAASKLLGELESALGVALFERLPRGVQATEYGRIMIRRANAALAMIDGAHQEVTQELTGIHGSVRIGAVLTPAARLVPNAVQRFKASHPRVQVTATADTSNALVARLRAGELDLVIGRVTDLALASELHFEPISDDPHSLVVRAGHPWLNSPALSLADLAAGSWIMPPPGKLRDRLTALFLTQGLDLPSDVFESMALTMIAPLLETSNRVAALPADLLRHYLDTGRLALLPLKIDLRRDVYGIITRRQHGLSPAATAMLDALRDEAGIPH